MQKIVVLVLVFVGALAAPAAAQRGGAGGSVTFAITVADRSGARIPDVEVTMTGPAQRTGRTEAGRLVFENVPAGTYRFRFDKEGFVSLEKELAARGARPIDVSVTLDAAPPPPKPLAPVPPPAPPPPSAVKPVVLDMPAFIEKNYVGRGSGKTTPLGCGSRGSAALIQLNDPIASHAHADADEYIYVIAGQGTATLGTREESLGPGVYLLIPRGLAHGFTAGPKKPLEMISIRAGGTCGA